MRRNFTSLWNSLRQIYNEYQSAPGVCNGTTPRTSSAASEYVTAAMSSRNSERPDIFVDQGLPSESASRSSSRNEGYLYGNRRKPGPGGRAIEGGGLMPRDSLQTDKISLSFSCLSGDYLSVATSDSEAEMEPRGLASRVDTPPAQTQMEMPAVGGQPIAAAPEQEPQILATTTFYHPDDYLSIPSTFLAPQHRHGEGAQQSDAALSPISPTEGTDHASNDSILDSSSFSSLPMSSTKASTDDSSSTLVHTTPPQTLQRSCDDRALPTPVAYAPQAPPAAVDYPIAQPTVINGIDSVRPPLQTHNMAATSGPETPLAVDDRRGLTQEFSSAKSDSRFADTAGISHRTGAEGVNLRDHHLSAASRDSRTSNSSFGLGLTDLSSDFMAAFDKWDVK